MYKHILIAIDDSPTSRAALDEAITLARLHGATLEITHAVDESLVEAFKAHGAALVNTDDLEKSLKTGAKALLAEAHETALQAGITARSRLLAFPDTHVADQIATAVEHSGADLLVVGSHGRRGFRRFLLGSIAENLVRKIGISMLIVRGQPEHE